MFDRFKRECGRGDRYGEVVQRPEGLWFIQPDGGGKDVFVHISAVEKAGLNGLNEGAKVTYDIVSDRGKEFCGKFESEVTVPTVAGPA